ncbi:hypothetical protein QZM46_22065 [Burkholderia vietnamiensis]|jgi:hypothetical protein|uniref:Lipoprotein n=3 Tax=Burkholderia cepacia complex TaxID=87882 RepID=A4JPR2_BURVG|nr:MULTISPECIES: hypothetical protein [Burkholderia]ABO58265.1 conserved hypothetical protein [Burkholderia vietnamiensis G4]AFJ89283.1 hypothetical protein MYA_4935 [Burkholderia sp. KJ006]AJY04472.1 hypothetical protein AK36_3564 [Burkholderia vietnamiensis LMG 10929]AOJ78504.1 hypothetical protein WJ35_26390 [Burkholderia ubonensis]AOJ98925.1 hypothetical protein WK23_09925 [Burkholderia vietnamiensis]
MKQNLIAAVVMLTSLTAYAADRATDDVQSNVQTSSNTEQTTKPSPQHTLSPGNAAGAPAAPPSQGMPGGSWSQLGSGWKQFGETGKAAGTQRD